MKRVFKICITVLVFVIIIFLSLSIYLSVKVNNILNDLSENGKISEKYSSIISEEAQEVITGYFHLYEDSDDITNYELLYYHHSVPLTFIYGMNAKVKYHYSVGVAGLDSQSKINYENNSLDIDVELILKFENLQWKIIDASSEDY